MKYFFVTGMFRSGTTMVARMLHASPYLICASDPFAPLFKQYRNSILLENKYKIDLNEPINDYQMNQEQYRRYECIKTSNLDMCVPNEVLENLKIKTIQHAYHYSGKIIPLLDTWKGETYRSLLKNGMNIIEKAYEKTEGVKAIGFKEVWMTEFTPHVLTLKDLQSVILIIRDPRAVIASNFASGSRYPIIFLLRQWRKIATLSAYYADKFDSCLLIKFEDLLAKSSSTVSSICNKLDIKFDERMMDERNYLDGFGEKWKINTSYKSKEEMGTMFKSNNEEKWRKILSKEELLLIESTLWPEMKYFGYDLVNKRDDFRKLDLLSYTEETEQLAEWIIPYSNYSIKKELMKEIERIDLLESDEKISKESKEFVCLEEWIFDTLSQYCKR